MKKEYDFTNAEQGKFYKPAEQLDMPIYLDREIIEYILKKWKKKDKDFSLSKIINALLKKDIEISEKLSN
ncbi:MAG: hypothetical protein AB7V07_09015 [Candidatus Delongbacteria bacterium]